MSRAMQDHRPESTPAPPPRGKASVSDQSLGTDLSAGQTTLWASGDAYERYMGRWSRRIAPLFLDWVSPQTGLDWLDIGCGTGVLSEAILTGWAPAKVCGVDPAAVFVEAARARVKDPRWAVRHGSAEALPCETGEFSSAVSGLVFNFVGDRGKALAEMRRVVRPGGTVALYVWDYAGHMQIARYFFDAAAELDAGATDIDDVARASFCRPGPLTRYFTDAGLADVEVQALDITAAFDSFDDYWAPFLGGTGTAPKYCVTLSTEMQIKLRENLRVRLPSGPDGEILMAMRAWGVKGRV